MFLLDSPIASSLRSGSTLAAGQWLDVRMEELLGQLGEDLHPCLAGEVYATLAKVFANIVQKPCEPKFRRLNKSSKFVAERICVSAAATSLLLRVGFAEEESAYCWPSGAVDDDLKEALCLIQRIMQLPGLGEWQEQAGATASDPKTAALSVDGPLESDQVAVDAAQCAVGTCSLLGASAVGASETASGQVADRARDGACSPGRGGAGPSEAATAPKGRVRASKAFKRRLADTARAARERAAEDLAELRRQQQDKFRGLQGDPFARLSPTYKQLPCGEFPQDSGRPGWLSGTPTRLARGFSSTSRLLSASCSGASKSVSRKLSRGFSAVSSRISSAWASAPPAGGSPGPAQPEFPAYFEVVDPGGAFIFHGPEVGSVVKGGLPAECFFMGLGHHWNEEGLRVMLRLDHGADGWVNVREGVVHRVVIEAEPGATDPLST